MLDYAPGNIVYVKFATVRPSTGAPHALSGGTISVYKDNSTTQSTTGVSLTADFDGVTGLNHVTIDTSADGTFYSAGSSFQVVITAGTVDSVSVVGQVVGEFTLNRASVLRPTTAGRTLDVSAGGEAGIDLANVGSPTTTLNLSGTTIKTATDVETDTADIQSRIPATLVSGRIDASVGAMAANTLTASALATDAVTEIQSGLATAANLAIVAGYLDTEVAAIKAVTDKLDTAMVLDGAVYQFTANALELGPSGSGGTSDWTADERTAIRTILGVPSSGTTPEVPSAGALKVIDTEIAALATSIADVPTNAELTAALGTGTWATAIPWNASWDAEVQSECTDALNAYDPPTNSEFEARTILAASYATAVEVAKVIKTGEEFTATDGTGSKDVTFTRV